MPWFKVDDGFHGHPKVIELSLASVGLWTLAGSWCAKYLTDGEINLKAIRRLGGDQPQADELVAANLWGSDGDVYQFNDWEDYQPLKAAIEDERDAARERMQSVRAKKKGVQPNNVRTITERSEHVQPNNPRTFGGSSEEVRVTPTRPTQPEPEGSKEPSSLIEAKKAETKLPKDWAPTAAHIKTAKERHVDVMDEAENFRLHAETHDRRAASWNGAFSTWLKKAKPKAAANTGYMNPGNW